MTVVDASVAAKWFLPGEPLSSEARAVLHEIRDDPRGFLVPELFMNELLAVLARMHGCVTGSNWRSRTPKPNARSC